MKPEEHHSMGLFSDGKTEETIECNEETLYNLFEDIRVLKEEIKGKPLLDLDWLPMDSAPIGGGCEIVLLKFDEQTVSVGYWDLYYAEGGRGYEGGLAWIEPCSGERLDLHYDEPIGWMPIKGEVDNET